MGKVESSVNGAGSIVHTYRGKKDHNHDPLPHILGNASGCTIDVNEKWNNKASRRKQENILLDVYCIGKDFLNITSYKR